MITIYHDLYEGRHYLRVTGHADETNAAEGRRVCAAVSALAELLATEIAEDKDAFASLESGDALITWSGHNAVWHALQKKFSRFADDFSKNLSYTEGIWWAK